MDTEHPDFTVVNERYQQLVALTTAPYVLKLPMHFKHLWPVLENVTPYETQTYRFKHARIMFEDPKDHFLRKLDELKDIYRHAPRAHIQGLLQGMQIAGRILGVITE